MLRSINITDKQKVKFIKATANVDATTFLVDDKDIYQN